MQKTALSELVVSNGANSVHLVGNVVVSAHAVVCKGLYLVAAVGYGSYLAEGSKKRKNGWLSPTVPSELFSTQDCPSVFEILI